MLLTKITLTISGDDFSPARVENIVGLLNLVDYQNPDDKLTISEFGFVTYMHPDYIWHSGKRRRL
jgi:hypothetical protein